jgi:serine protease AprX
LNFHIIKSCFSGFILFLAFFLLADPGFAQNKYWVFLKDKKGVSFDPYQYFDQKAIQRRQRQNLPLSDETDKPINPEYLRQVSQLSDSVSGSSRWLNAVACFVPQNRLKQLRALPFVHEIIPFSTAKLVVASAKKGQGEVFFTGLSEEKNQILANQLNSLGAETFRAQNLDGKGIRIAVLDAGFKSVNFNPAFEHIRQQNHILKTWDFVKRREYVYDYATHGTEVLSCIAGRLTEKPIGLAPNAEFLLARTERMHYETYSEEENWLAAMEWADKNGADIINSSLGYTNDRYFREQMNGRTAMVARAANLAARKGILVVNANGNDGTEDSWKIVGTPADADSVLAVGGISADDLFHVDFSSYGPTADKRLKPNVSAFGEVVAAGPKGFEEMQGTSFSSPLVAGFAACAWQADRKLTNMQLFKAIERSGHLYPYFDYAHGFGVPQASSVLKERPKATPTFDFIVTNSRLSVKIKPEFLADSGKTVLSGQELPVLSENNPYMYYHLADKRNVLLKYFVVEALEPEVISIPVADIKPGTTIRVHYRGYTGVHLF